MQQKSFKECLQDEIAEHETEIENRRQLLKMIEGNYPDLERHINRWKKVRYTSVKVNPIVTDYDIAHNCGCCKDLPLEVWPYVEIDGFRIYAKGIPFRVGEKYPWGYGEVEYPGWEEKLHEAKIAETVIQGVRRYLNGCKPRDDYDFDEEDD